MNRHSVKMDILYLLLVINSVSGQIQQTCRELRVHEIAHQNKYLNKHIMTCLDNVSLDQCALECLLLKMCKSLNYIKYRDDVHGPMCELNYKNHNDTAKSDFEDRYKYVYVDIREWPKEMAGTCSSRPCKENQRCMPTTPYRCIDVDCGTPVVRHITGLDTTNLYHLPTTTSLGSRAYYKCRDKNKHRATQFNPKEGLCLNAHYNLCNSNSSWITSALFCMYLPISL